MVGTYIYIQDLTEIFSQAGPYEKFFHNWVYFFSSWALFLRWLDLIRNYKCNMWFAQDALLSFLGSFTILQNTPPQ